MQTLSESEEKYIKGWSWGAFLGTWVFLFVNKKRKLGLEILVVFLLNIFLSYAPYLNIGITSHETSLSGGFGILRIIYLGLAIWLGIRGREMAWKDGNWSSVEEFKNKQKLVTKLTALVIVVNIIGSFFFLFYLGSQYANHPELLDQQVMQGALADAKSSHTGLNDNEFIQGYQKGVSDFKNMVSTTPFVANNSSELGYQYGYVLSCTKASSDPVKTADDESCVKKVVAK